MFFRKNFRKKAEAADGSLRKGDLVCHIIPDLICDNTGKQEQTDQTVTEQKTGDASARIRAFIAGQQLNKTIHYHRDHDDRRCGCGDPEK